MTRTTITLFLTFATLACAAPSDDELCAHVLTMQMSQANASGSPSDADMKLCLEHLPQLRARIGEGWNEFSRCALRAKTEGELQACSPKLAEIAEQDRRRARDQLRSSVDAQRELTKEYEEAIEAAKATKAERDKAEAAEGS
ncbi:hypothetical protein [Enhygromyxa salina]|uniref:hypothetical protein n=1 Tax=Enhygromyxa salina TaxID=215803 RepID=UPI0011B20C9C|nr:hypothetical protein [Enhygromyxa salina]